MSALVLLNLFNKLGKRGKMQGLQSILSIFVTSLLNSTGAQMLDSIYYMMLNLFCNHVFGVKMSGFCQT